MFWQIIQQCISTFGWLGIATPFLFEQLNGIPAKSCAFRNFGSFAFLQLFWMWQSGSLSFQAVVMSGPGFFYCPAGSGGGVWCVVGCRLPHHSGETTPPQHKGIHLWAIQPGTTGINIFQLWHDRLDTPYLTYSYILSDKPHNSEYVEKNNNCPLSSNRKDFTCFYFDLSGC